jgi:hypothetical protein
VSERRAAAPAPDSIAVMSDHLGRLLQHADRLIREWQEHADGLRLRFEAEARTTGDVLHKTLEDALAEVATQSSTYLNRHFLTNAERLSEHLARAQQAAEKLETTLRRTSSSPASSSSSPARGGEDFSDLARQIAALREEIAASGGGASRRPRGGGTARAGNESRLTLVLSLSANVLLVALIAIALLRTPRVTVKQTPAAAGATGTGEPAGAPAVDAGAGGAASPADPPPLAVRAITPCSTIALSGAEAQASVADCVKHVCELPDGEKPSLPDNCKPIETKLPKSKATKKQIVCTIGDYELTIDLPGECPAVKPAR